LAIAGQKFAAQQQQTGG